MFLLFAVPFRLGINIWNLFKSGCISWEDHFVGHYQGMYRGIRSENKKWTTCYLRWFEVSSPPVGVYSVLSNVGTLPGTVCEPWLDNLPSLYVQGFVNTCKTDVFYVGDTNSVHDIQYNHILTIYMWLRDEFPKFVKSSKNHLLLCIFPSRAGYPLLECASNDTSELPEADPLAPEMTTRVRPTTTRQTESDIRRRWG